MSYLESLKACNNFDPARYTRLVCGQAAIGHVLAEQIPHLWQFGDLFAIGDKQIVLLDQGSPEATSARLEAAVRILVDQRVLHHFREEAFAVAARWGSPVLFTLDRGAVPLLGTRAYGVHVNGFVRREEGFHLWIGRRSPDKQVAPGKLDNMIGGGIDARHSVFETLIKEADEEASVGPALAGQARSVGALAYRMQQPGGSRDDVLFVYDLEVPEDFIPVGKDGEIVHFELMPIERCLELVRTGDAFKFNVTLVLVDFAIRHGIIGVDEPDYLEIQRLLRAGLYTDLQN